METASIRRGSCAHLPGIDLCVMRVEPVGEEVWAQVLVIYGSHQEVATMRIGDPIDLPDGVRLTVIAIERPEGREPLVHLSQEWTSLGD